jgi:hypothetical protein
MKGKKMSTFVGDSTYVRACLHIEIPCGPITKHAERKCRKLRMGQVAFSPELQHASRTIRAVTVLLRKKEGHKVSSRLLARSLQKVSLASSLLGRTTDHIKSLLKQSYDEYFKIKKSTLHLEGVT